MKVYTACTTSELSELVATLVGDNPLEKVAVFCEDKFTLSLELAIAKKHGGTFGVNVYSFNRFMHKFLPEDKKCLSQESCALVVKNVLLRKKGELKCFKKVNEPSLASTVYELIAQLKSAKITPYDIKRAGDECENGNLKNKLEDIGYIFSEYENFVNGGVYTDGNNRLYRLPEFFDNDNQIKNTKVIIAGFPSLNKTLCEIFKSLVKNAKEVCFAVVAGDNKNLYTNETYQFVMKEYAPELQEQKTFEVKQKLLDTLFVPGLAIDEKDKYQSNAVYYYEASNPEDEIKRIAKYIRKSVINGARYKDFAITCENLGDYELLINRVFADYEIPCFFDSSKNLSKHPLTRLTCSYIDVVRTNFNPEKVLEFIKNPLFTPDKDLADGFENYFISYAINRKTIKQPFVYEDKQRLEYEILRDKLCKVCGYLKREVTFGEAVQAIEKMLKDLNVEGLIKNLSDKLKELNYEELAFFNKKGAEEFERVLKESVSLFGEQKSPLTEVKNVIVSGMTACKVPLIPARNDCVYVGDFRSVKYGGYNVVFAVGLCNGVPSSKLDTALLCDRDIDKMQKSKVLVEPKIKEVNRRSRETACMALASFKQKLFVSYPKVSVGGKTVKSEMFERIQSVFALPSGVKNPMLKLNEEQFGDSYLTKRSATLQFVKQINEYKEAKQNSKNNLEWANAYYYAVKNSGDKNQSDVDILNRFLNIANAEPNNYTEGVNYYNKNGLSATTIEGYFSCPYKNFLQSGLKLKERLKSSIASNDLGTMVHAVAEEFVKDAFVGNKKEIESCEQARALAKEKFDQVVADAKYSRYLQSAEGVKSFEFIQKECLRFCEDLYLGVKNSSFKPNKIEVEFGFKGKPAIEIKTPSGVKKVTGVVDRIDVFLNQMRIVDYKTGHIDESKIEEDLYSGEKLQLFLYASAFSKRYKPVGVYYFPIADKFSEENESGTMALEGRTLDDLKTAKQLDYSFEESEKGVYVDANFKEKKQGGFLYPQKLLSETEFSAFSNYASKVAGNALNEIEKGLIVATPTEGSCEYCKYHGVCGFDKTDGKTRCFYGINKQKIVDALQEDKDCGNNEKILKTEDIDE